MPLGGAKDEHFSCFHSSCQWGLSPSNGPNQQITPHPTRWHYPLITYLSSKWPNNLWTKFVNSGHCVQAASTASSVVLCPLYLQLVCWRSVRKKAPKIVWSQYLASGEKGLTCCYLTSFFIFVFEPVAYDIRNDKLSQRVNCDSRNCHLKLM